jgi:hypothetical protein
MPSPTQPPPSPPRSINRAGPGEGGGEALNNVRFGTSDVPQVVRGVGLKRGKGYEDQVERRRNEKDLAGE